MPEFMVAMMKMGFAIILIFLVLVIAAYIGISFFINKFHKLVENKGTALAWIPVANLYILGKLLINKGFGWALVIVQVIISILTSTTTVTVNGESTTTSILSSSASSTVSLIWGFVSLGLLVWAVVKYVKVKRDGGSYGYSSGSHSSGSSKADKNMPQEKKVNPADNLWGWKDSDSAKM